MTHWVRHCGTILPRAGTVVYDRHSPNRGRRRLLVLCRTTVDGTANPRSIGRFTAQRLLSYDGERPRNLSHWDSGHVHSCADDDRYEHLHPHISVPNFACKNPIVFSFLRKKTMIIALLRTPKFANPAIQGCMSLL
jgi:hypothetical protein